MLCFREQFIQAGTQMPPLFLVPAIQYIQLLFADETSWQLLVLVLVLANTPKRSLLIIYFVAMEDCGVRNPLGRSKGRMGVASWPSVGLATRVGTLPAPYH
jgi:hypothetical protein